MKKELSQSITKDCPNLYSDIKYIETGDGWFDLIRELSLKLEALIMEFPEEERSYYRALQIKEKFAGLRVYLNLSNTKMEDLIHAAESKSYEICETCGKPGIVRSGGWLYTACDEHIR